MGGDSATGGPPGGVFAGGGGRPRAGRVAAVPDLATPVVVARAMLEVGEHVILAGVPALRYAAEIGLTPAPPGTLVTPRAYAQLRDAQAGTPITSDIGGVGAVAGAPHRRHAGPAARGRAPRPRPGRPGATPAAPAGA